MVFIQLNNEKVFIVEVELTDTIKQLKMKIQNLEKIPYSQQRLFFNWCLLKDDNHTLNDYKIENESIIDLVSQLNPQFIFIRRTLSKKLLILGVELSMTVKNLKDLIQNQKRINFDQYHLMFKRPLLDDYRKLVDYGIKFGYTIDLKSNCSGGGGNKPLLKEINIKFIKSKEEKSKNKISFINNELTGLLRLCLLKEISIMLDLNQIRQLPILISYIMELLKKNSTRIIGYKTVETIRKVLLKMEGCNIINISKFINEKINQNELQMLKQLLNKKDLEYIIDIEKRLLKYEKYMSFFVKDFEERKKQSIFEFAIISLVVMEREDFENFEKERKNCPNRIDRILYHGTSIEPISCILTGYFKKSVNKCYQHGKGVYFTDMLDY